MTSPGKGVVKEFFVEEKTEKGGAKDHFAIFLGRGLVLFSRNGHAQAHNSASKGIQAALAACIMKAGSKRRALPAFATGGNHI